MPKAEDTPISPRQRGPALENLRNQKMARSALDYVRGSPTKFYEWLEKCSAAIPQGPEIWICGDCHVGNLGPVANADGQFQVEIRDFDQTVIGNPAHDLIRLGLSLAAAAVVSDLPGLTIAEILEAMIGQYEAAFNTASDETGYLQEPKTIRKVNRRAARASWTSLAAEDMDGKNFKLPIGERFWPLMAEERREIERLFSNEDIRRLVTEEEGRDDDADVRMIDAAYWRKGCSSLGHLRYAVLLQVGRKSDRRRHCLMDIKEAVKPQAAAFRGDAARLCPSGGGGRFAPFALSRKPHATAGDNGTTRVSARIIAAGSQARNERPRPEEAARVAGYLAAVVGQAHGRQMELDERRGWCKELRRNRAKALNAPSWLWRSVVDLLLDHQSGYLEHCRAASAAA